MARAVEGYHSFSSTPTRLSTNEMNHTVPAFALTAEAGPHLPTPQGWKAELA